MNVVQWKRPAIPALQSLPSCLLLHGTPRLSLPCLFPLWPACWIQCPDPSRKSSSSEVQNVRDIKIQELRFVSIEVRDRVRSPSLGNDGDARNLWSQKAEAGTLRAYQAAGGTPPLLVLALLASFGEGAPVCSDSSSYLGDLRSYLPYRPF